MKIGLALGAGAARGWAHMGIIDALADMGIKPDIIAGASIGAYVGATYASGNLPQLKEWAFTLDEWQILGLLGVGLNKGGIASGERVFEKLHAEFCTDSFEQMDIPFACNATNLYTGREVVFNAGEVGESIRASCSIPGLFSPVYYQEQWLVDGAVVNPVPVNLCRQLGADFVIAVNLSADFRPEMAGRSETNHRETQRSTDNLLAKSQTLIRNWFSPDAKSGDTNPPGVMSVMSNALDIMQARVTRSRLAGDPPHILIEPQLRNVGILEFNKAEEVYDLGKLAVKRLEAQIDYQFSYINQ